MYPRANLTEGRPANMNQSSAPPKVDSKQSTTTTSFDGPVYPSDWKDDARIESTSSLVEISISCVNLPDMDIVTKSDPQVIVYRLDSQFTRQGSEMRKIEIGRTEVIQDDLNPKFARKILVQYHFEQIQHLRFEVFDIDPVGGNDFLGSLDTTLADIVTARGSSFKQPLVGGPKRRKPGELIVDVEELTMCKKVASFRMGATDLDPSFCGLLSPSVSVHIYRSNESGNLTVVQRSTPVPRSCNPQFAPFQLKLVTVCNGDLDRSIRFELVDQRLGMHRHLGYFDTTMKQLRDASRLDSSKSQLFDLMRLGKSPSSSKVCISDFKLSTQATFLDYIRAGAQIHFVVAIDFTGSNGDPTLAGSLHYLDPLGRHLNPYESCLLAVGNILKPYDTMGMFAGFGFGAKLRAQRPPSHRFPLNDNDLHPYVSSVEDLLAVYRAKVRQVTLSGPTNFAPCIQHCDTIARQFEHSGDHYFVLLIVTDGIISDMAQTKQAIVEASRSPMSIIICGVGDAQFDAMDQLDSDDSLLRSPDGRKAERDIVQFVPMNRFMPQTTGSHQAYGSHSQQPGANQLGMALETQRLLAEEVLREIPDQLTGYMVAHNLHSELTSSNLD